MQAHCAKAVNAGHSAAVRALGLPALAIGLLIGAIGVAPHPAWAQAATPDAARLTLRERLAQARAARKLAAPDAASTVAAGTVLSGPGDYSLSLMHAGLNRLYRVHVPATYTPSKPSAMVLSFHGGGGNMDVQATDRYYGQISKSEQLGYIAVFPNGFSRLPSGKLATWNAGHCCAAARDADVDDVGFVRALVQQLSSQLNIDPQRVFAAGMSNGGMMAYRLACELPEIFKAIAAVAGTDNTKACSPKAPVSILHIHARDDERVLFNGGAGQPSPNVSAFVAVPDSIAKWVKLNACPTSPKRVFETTGAYCDAYVPCRAGTEVKLCVTETGGHSWPGGQQPRGIGTPSTALSATDVMADFFLSR